MAKINYSGALNAVTKLTQEFDIKHKDFQNEIQTEIGELRDPLEKIGDHALRIANEDQLPGIKMLEGLIAGFPHDVLKAYKDIYTVSKTIDTTPPEPLITKPTEPTPTSPPSPGAMRGK